MSRARRGRAARSSDSDSSDDEDPHVISEALYRELQLAAALRRPADFAVAAGELAAIARQLYARRCSKAVQALVLQDMELAITCCDGRMQSRTALAALMEAAERCLPQAKRNALLRQYRQSSVQLRRRQRRGGSGAAGAADWSDDDADQPAPATFAHLPTDVTEQVFRYLDPITLAHCACVCREWRAAAEDDALWQPHCARLLGGGRAASSSGPQQQQQQQQAPAVSWRQRFAAAARQRPERLLPWRTNRALVGRRLAWLPAEKQQERQQSASCRHVGTAEVVAWLKSGGSRGGHGSGSGSDSSSSDDDSGGQVEADGLGRKLRFWQL